MTSDFSAGLGSIGGNFCEEVPVKLHRDRFDYSPLPGRRPFKLPKGARIAVWTIVNVEE